MIGKRRGNRWIIVVALAVLPGLLLLTLGSAHAAEEGPREGHFTAPDIPLNVSASNFGTASVSPGIYQTSEYMIGSVAVGLILPESDGAIDANVSDWTSDQRRRVMDQVKQGLEWWSRQAPAAHLTFVIV